MKQPNDASSPTLFSMLPAYIASALGAMAGAAVFFLFAAWTHYYIYLLAVLTGFFCMLGYTRLHGPKGWPQLICLTLFTFTAVTLGFCLFHAFRLHVLKTKVFDGISFRLFILVHPVMETGKTMGDVVRNWLITLAFACLGFIGKDTIPFRRRGSDDEKVEGTSAEAD